jgi:hypothetical protein
MQVFTPADPISLAAFLLVVIGVITAVTAAVYRSTPNPDLRKRTAARVLAGILIWLTLLGALIHLGALAALPHPGLTVFFLASSFAGVRFARSSLGQRISTRLPLAYLVGFHAYRFPMGLILHAWAKQGVVPSTMTWTGWNFDGLTGLAAIVLAPLTRRHPAAARVFNVVGWILLVDVMGVAVMSSPVPFGWDVHPPLQLSFHVPYFLIVPVCAAGALAGQIILTRRLRNS